MKKLISLFALLVLAVSMTYAQSVDEIVNANLAAHGGIEKLKAVKSVYAELNLSIMGMSMPVKVWKKEAGKFRMEQSSMGQSVVIVSDGEKAWAGMPGNVEELPIEQMQAVMKTNPSITFITDYPLVDYKANKYTVTNAGNDVINGKQCVILKVDYNKDFIVNIFIDKETNLECKYEIIVPSIQAQLENADQEITEEQEMMLATMQPELFINEWGEFSGLKFPKSLDHKMGDMTQKILLEKCDINPSIEDSKFSKP